MLFLHNCSLISDVDDMKMAVHDLAFSRLVFELSAKESLKRLVEQVSDCKSG